MRESEVEYKPITEWEYVVEKWTEFIIHRIRGKVGSDYVNTLNTELTNFRNMIIRNHDKTLKNKGLLTNEVTKDE